MSLAVTNNPLTVVIQTMSTSVTTYLAKQNIPSTPYGVGFGESRAVARTQTEEGYQLNRHMQLTLIPVSQD
jgi:outer membrane protein OmpA-like peptidoglycan-associated protein